MRRSVSIALATYNGDAFLREQLESLARQTQLPVEVVISDDGSSDTTIEIASSFAASAPFPVRIERQPRQLGYADNFLTAASLCRGDLVAFCDQDDVWLPEKIERCARWFHEDANVALVAHAVTHVDEHLVPLATQMPERPLRRRRALQYRLWDFHFIGHTLVFDAALVRDVSWGIRPLDYTVHGPMPHDHWIPLLASTLGTTVFEPGRLSLYRQHRRNTAPTTTSSASSGSALRRRLGSSRASTRERSQAAVKLFAQWGDTLEELADSATSTRRAAFLRGAVYQRAISANYARRARILSAAPRSWHALSGFTKLVGTGVYVSRRRGGMGAQALAEDGLAVLLGRD